MEPSFEDYFVPVLNSLVEEEEKLERELSTAWKTFQTLAEYTVQTGSHRRGKLVVNVLRLLVPSVSPAQVELASKIGWLWLLHEAGVLVADDVMDQSEVRREKPCWYRVNNRGLAAFNDMLTLEHATFQLLRKFLADQPEMYMAMLHLLLDISFKTALGQSMDLEFESKCQDFDSYTMDVYKCLATHKTAYYGLCLPIQSAMILAGMRKDKDEKNWIMVEGIALQLGSLLQVGDDYRDCFASEQISGKIGSDICNGKNTWLFVRAKEICMEQNLEEEWTQLKANYGRSDEDSVGKVKEIYVKLGIKDHFENYAMSVMMDITAKTASFSKEMRGFQKLFDGLIDDIMNKHSELNGVF